MSFRQLRKVPGLDNIVKDLAEKLQRSLAEHGLEDITLFRQNRVAYDLMALNDSSVRILNGDVLHSDNIVYADAETKLLQSSRVFTIPAIGDGSDQAQPLMVGYSDMA